MCTPMDWTAARFVQNELWAMGYNAVIRQIGTVRWGNNFIVIIVD